MHTHTHTHTGDPDFIEISLIVMITTLIIGEYGELCGIITISYHDYTIAIS
jgi:hypothetical protein